MSYSRKVFYYETDKMGIVHHSNYIRWFEEARIQLLDDLGLSLVRIEEAGLIIPVLSVSAEYKKMLHFGEDFQVSIQLEFYNGSRFSLLYEVFSNGELTTTGKSSHCFLNASGRLVKLSRNHPEIDEIFKKLETQDR